MSDVKTQVMAALSTVIEPELHRDIVSLNMVRDLSVEGDTANFTIVLTTPACPLKNVFERSCNAAVIGKVPGHQPAANQVGCAGADRPQADRAARRADAQHRRHRVR